MLGIKRKAPYQKAGYMIVFGLVDVAQGLVTVLSFGQLSADWTLRLAFWDAQRQHRKMNA